jgi:hypothetical protein
MKSSAALVDLDCGSAIGLDVVVIHLGKRQTLTALRVAAKLAEGLQGAIRLLVAHVVAYPLPLESPAVELATLARQFNTISEEARVDPSVEICLCRDPWEAIGSRLKPRSIVVLAGPRRWWPTREARLARRLRRAGHSVILSECK